MMSLDYLDIRKDLRKDTLNYKYLIKKSKYFDTGILKYSLCNKSPLDVFYNPHSNTLRIKGSPPYFLHGHNFKTTNQDVLKSLLLASDMLNVNLFDCEVLAFENGLILEPDLPIKEILANHIRVKGMKTRTHDNGKYFVDSTLRIKLYNENVNMYKIPLQIRNEANRDFDYNSTKKYLKIENHYKSPEAYFKERGIKVSTLFYEDFENDLKNDLVTTYQRIKKTGVIEMPSNKRKFSTATLLLMALKETERIYGFDSNVVIKNILKSSPSEVLSRDNRKDRMKQIRKLTKPLQSSQHSIYDLSELLVSTLT